MKNAASLATRTTKKTAAPTRTRSLCPLCDDALDGGPSLACAACGAKYHRACRVAAGRCPTDGCRRASGLAPKPAPTGGSALDVDVGPYVWGALWAVPLSGGLSAALHACGGRNPLIFVALWLLSSFLLGVARSRFA
jgi:hypothetical protein